MSSSSSPDSLADLLRDSLATLEREVPACHGRLLAGGTTVRDALLEDRLRVRGTTASLLRLTDGLAAYLHGAVRSPSFPALLHRFHAIAAKDPAHASQARL